MNQQGAFFDDSASLARDVKAQRPAPTHRDDPSTSHAAARAIAVAAGTIRARILIDLLHAVDGRTAEEAWKSTGAGRFPHVAATRLLELASLTPPLVCKTDRTRPTASGCEAHVWVVTDAGRRVAVELERSEAAA